MKTLRDYVITYTVKDENGNEKIAANVADYYDNVVHGLKDLFKERSLNHQRTVICPLHEDTDPSLGLMNHRHLPKVRVFHCFGCNCTGDVVRFHQLIESKYHQRNLNEKTACEEVAKMFGIPLEDFEELAEDDYEGKYARISQKIDEEVKHSYTIRDFTNDILELRKKSEQVDLKALNHASIKMIATQKQLYNT